MRAYTYRHVVTLDETNIVGNVYFAHYVHWQGHCREHFLKEHAPGVVRAIQRGEIAMVTLACSVSYHIECVAFDTIEVAMTLRESAGNRIAMDFDYMRGSDLVARGTQAVACMRRTDSKVIPVELPDELLRALMAFT